MLSGPPSRTHLTNVWEVALLLSEAMILILGKWIGKPIFRNVCCRKL